MYRKICLLVTALFMIECVSAQIKTIDELELLSRSSIGHVKDFAKSWEYHEKGKLKGNEIYESWVPKKIDNNTVADMIMCYYHDGQPKIDYIMYQTQNKRQYDKLIAEVKRQSKYVSSDKKPDGGKEDKYKSETEAISVTITHLAPGAPATYIFGAAPLPPKQAAPPPRRMMPPGAPGERMPNRGNNIPRPPGT